MHELTLIAEVCRLARAAADREGAARITRICVRLGDCCGVDAEALRLAFAVMQEQQCWHQTQLEIILVPTQCRCSICRCHYRPVDLIPVCPQCGGLCSERVGGQELELVGLEVA